MCVCVWILLSKLYPICLQMGSKRHKIETIETIEESKKENPTIEIQTMFHSRLVLHSYTVVSRLSPNMITDWKCMF